MCDCSKCSEIYIGENGKKYKIELTHCIGNVIKCKITFKKYFIFKYEKTYSLKFKQKRINLFFDFKEVLDFVHNTIIDKPFFHRELTKEILEYKY